MMTTFALRFNTLQKSQFGVTLIEVLITLVIMAVGLLGTAKMQILSTKSNHEASQRTTATHIIEDIIARMNSTPLSNLENYDTSTTPISTLNPTSEPAACTVLNNCNVTNKTLRDKWEWKELLIGSSAKKNSTNASGLVNPSGCIQVDNTKTNQVRIIVSWDGIGKSKASSTTSCGSVSSSNYKRRSQTIYSVF